VIVCDGCGRPIPYPYVWILVLGGSPWGTQCQECKDKYFSKLPAFIALTEEDAKILEYLRRKGK